MVPDAQPHGSLTGPGRHEVSAEILSSLSGGKLATVSAETMTSLRTEAEERACQVMPLVLLTEIACLPGLRRLSTAFARSANLSEDRTDDFILCVTEAATNVLVHASSGSVAGYAFDGRIQVWLQDRGTGLDLPVLARVLLLRGYSSKQSLGVGLHLILGLSDRVTIHTTPHGTTLMIEFATN